MVVVEEVVVFVNVVSLFVGEGGKKKGKVEGFFLFVCLKKGGEGVSGREKKKKKEKHTN